MYIPVKPWRSLFVELRGLKHHVRVWGDDDAPPLFFFHGAWDASPTFQFIVDALKQPWRVLALDWRGYGQSAWAQSYWFLDLVADMEAFADRFSPYKPISIVGHSLGSNTSQYLARMRPGRIGRFVSLDGFSMIDDSPESALERHRCWLDDIKTESRMKSYTSTAEMAERLMRGHPLLTADKAAFLVENLSRRDSGGGFVWAFDPRHRNTYPVESRPDGWSAGLQDIDSAVLLLSGGLNRAQRLPVDAVDRRIGLIPRHAHIHIKDAGHNLHHDAPELVATIAEPFLATGKLPAHATIGRHS